MWLQRHLFFVLAAPSSTSFGSSTRFSLTKFAKISLKVPKKDLFIQIMWLQRHLFYVLAAPSSIFFGSISRFFLTKFTKISLKMPKRALFSIYVTAAPSSISFGSSSRFFHTKFAKFPWKRPIIQFMQLQRHLGICGRKIILMLETNILFYINSIKRWYQSSKNWPKLTLQMAVVSLPPNSLQRE